MALVDLGPELVDDGVEADLDVLALGDFGRACGRADVEADDDGVRGGGEEHVRLGDGADAGVQDADADLLGGHALERSSAMTSTEPCTSPLTMRLRSLTPACLICSARPSSETRGALGELGFALLHLAVLRDALGLVAVGHDEEGVAGVGHAFEAEDFDGGGGAGFGDGRPRSSNMARILPKVLPTM
jgi:hypothetical protein